MIATSVPRGGATGRRAERAGLDRLVAAARGGVGWALAVHGEPSDRWHPAARDAIAFITAMQVSRADLLGFSIGSFVAQQVALTRPAIVRRLVLASSAPPGRGRHARLGA